MVVSGSAAVTYLLDTHRANALHILALSNFGKNMVLYASTFFANGIILSHGVKVSLLILGGCQAVCWAASVPMFVFGKRVRSFVSICIGCCFRELRFLACRLIWLQIARQPQLFQGDLPASEFPHSETL